jgi:FkbM family methyltransferase
MTTVQERLADLRGLLHAFRLSPPTPWYTQRLARFYAQFIGPGALGFDLGANVGGRVSAWRRLGARVVAVEPQPLCVRVLRRRYGHDPRVRIVEMAVGAQPGRQALLISRRAPTISTLSPTWPAVIQHRNPTGGETWDARLPVPVTTLDALIARFGEPAFVKVDVEGYELEVLRGLSRPLRALSFEYVPGAIDRALPCLDRLQALGPYRFNVSPGESLRFALPGWVDAEQLADWLRRQTVRKRPGDVYARRVSPAA